MPYLWTDEPPATKRLKLWPHRSLAPRGFVIFIAITSGFFLFPLFAVLGTTLLWALLPFFIAAVAGVWWALSRNNRDLGIIEELVLTPDQITLTRRDPGGEERHWAANPYWVRVQCQENGGPVENYITLEGGPRRVEIGAFLSPDERAALVDEITRALNRSS